MFRNLFAAALALGTLGAIATPALALNGQQATELCQQNPTTCTVESGAPDGRIIIMSNHGMITCMSPQAECEVTQTERTATPKRQFQVPQSLIDSSGSSSPANSPPQVIQ